MSGKSTNLRKVKRQFEELAKITGDIADAVDREAEGQDVDQTVIESLTGRYIMKMIELDSLVKEL